MPRGYGQPGDSGSLWVVLPRFERGTNRFDILWTTVLDRAFTHTQSLCAACNRLLCLFILFYVCIASNDSFSGDSSGVLCGDVDTFFAFPNHKPGAAVERTRISEAGRWAETYIIRSTGLDIGNTMNTHLMMFDKHYNDRLIIRHWLMMLNHGGIEL